MRVEDTRRAMLHDGTGMMLVALSEMTTEEFLKNWSVGLQQLFRCSARPWGATVRPSDPSPPFGGGGQQGLASLVGRPRQLAGCSNRSRRKTLQPENAALVLQLSNTVEYQRSSTMSQVHTPTAPRKPVIATRLRLVVWLRLTSGLNKNSGTLHGQ